MNLFDRAEIDFHTLAEECRRECNTRRGVFPKLVSRGRMSRAEAERRIAIMAEAARLFQIQAELRDTSRAETEG